MNELHLFAGAGGGILGGILCGHTCIGAVEIEPYCQRVLIQRQRDGILPRFPIWDDIKTFDATPWRGRVDIVCGGFPCQDISVANSNAKGIDGDRSGLWKEMARVICEVRPKYAFVENSPALVTRGLGRVLADLAEMGMHATWGVLGAWHLGANHRRERIWILAHSNSIRLQGGKFIRKKIQRKGSEEQFKRLVCFQLQCSIPAGSFGRVSDGVANRMDRLKAVGNGQVPIVAATAFKILKSRLDNQ